MDRNKEAIKCCEETLNIKFEGDLDNKEQVKEFLDKYLRRSAEMLRKNNPIIQQLEKINCADLINGE